MSTMKKTKKAGTAGLLLGALLLSALPAQAQTLRWSSAGDVLTLDPYAQNETLTNVINGQVYEFLVARDKQLNLVPAAGHRMEADQPAEVGVQVAPRRQVP